MILLGLDTSTWTAGDWGAMFAIFSTLVGGVWWVSRKVGTTEQLEQVIAQHIPENQKDHDAFLLQTTKLLEITHQQALSLNDHNRRLEFHDKRIEHLENRKP